MKQPILIIFLPEIMQKRILFTGGAGYIGSHVVRYFVEKGIRPEDVVIVDIAQFERKRGILPAGCNYCEVDITDKKDLEEVFKKYDIGFVMHFAGLIQVGESMKDPGKYFNVNSFGGCNVLELMNVYKVKHIIFSSTAGVYGVPQYVPIDEEHPLHPISPYGESKLLFEKMLKWFDEAYHIKYVIFRYFNACGVQKGLGDYHNPHTHLIPSIILNLLGVNKEFSLYGNDYSTKDGTSIRDYVDVRDLAAAHYLAYQYLLTHSQSEVINLGTQKGTTTREVVDLIQKVSRRIVNVVVKPRRVGDPQELVCANDKARKILGWAPKFDLVASIESHWNWFKDIHAPK